jgi:hypothetical protein
MGHGRLRPKVWCPLTLTEYKEVYVKVKVQVIFTSLSVRACHTQYRNTCEQRLDPDIIALHLTKISMMHISHNSCQQ